MVTRSSRRLPTKRRFYRAKRRFHMPLNNQSNVNVVTNPQDYFVGRANNDPTKLRIPRVLSRQVFYFRQLVQKNSITSQNTVPTEVDYNFTFADLGNYTYMSALFDQYCILMVEATFRPSCQQAPAANVGPNFYSVIDWDDSSALATIAAASQYDNTLVTSANQEHRRTIKYPRFAVSAYAGSFGAYSSTTGWIDCASTGVQHYGLKVLAAPHTSSYAINWQVDMFYTIACRNVR